MLVHVCNPSYLGDIGRIVVQSWPQAKMQDPYLKSKLKQKEIGAWLKCTAWAVQARGPERKPQYCQKKKKAITS
jgi:hypothetical protein